MTDKFSEVRKKLEDLGWPDGRSVKSMAKEIEECTPFIVNPVKVSQRLFCLYANIRHIPKCYCGSDLKYSPKKNHDNPYSGWSLYCSKECADTSEGRMSKIKSTMIERYGVEHSYQSEELMEKAKETMMERHGVDHPSKSAEIVDARKQSNMERYGSGHHWGNKEIRSKSLATRYEKKYEGKPFGTLDIDMLVDSYQTIGAAATAEKIGVNVSTIYPILHQNGVELDYEHTRSFAEVELSNFISSLGHDSQTKVRDVIKPLELDIVIPDRNLAIEFNGVYWHSTKFRDKNYHINKTNACRDSGYRLLHIWEDEWMDPVKREIWCNKIKICLGIPVGRRVFARKCRVVSLTHGDCVDLLENNHIQGMTRATKYYGLTHEDELVAVMMFTKRKGVWELVRFCTSGNVIGGFSKLLSHFKKTEEWDEIVSFADLRVSDGGVYEKNGFVLDSVTPPLMQYTKGSSRYRREKFMKKNLPKLFENVDMSKTEKEIMEENGYYQLYDCGLQKWVIKRGH